MSTEIYYIDFPYSPDESGDGLLAAPHEIPQNVTPMRDSRSIFYNQGESAKAKAYEPTEELNDDKVAYFMNHVDMLISLELKQLPSGEIDERWRRVRTFLYRRCERLYLINHVDANDILLELPDVVHMYYMLALRGLPPQKVQR